MRVKIFITFIFLALIFPAISFSETADHVVVNEIQVADGEFVRLYNPTKDKVQLDGWYFSYYSKARDWNNPLRNRQFPDGAVIEANGYYLIGLNGSAEADWQPYESAQLNNTDGSVAIFPWDSSERTVAEARDGRIDAVGWGGTSFVKEGTALSTLPEVNESVKRKANGWDTEDNNKDFSSEEQASSKEKEAPVSSIKGVYLNEVMPNPARPANDSSGEWIELRNDSKKRIDLSGSFLRDGVGSVHKYKIPAGIYIDPGRYAIFYSSATRISLNNTGDFVEFLDRDGSVLDSTGTEYGDAEDGFSYAFAGGGWSWTEKPTPLADNIIVWNEEGDEDEDAEAEEATTKKKSSSKLKKSRRGSDKGGVKGSFIGNDFEEDLAEEKVENYLGNRNVGIFLLVAAGIVGFNYIIFRDKVHELFKQKR